MTNDGSIWNGVTEISTLSDSVAVVTLQRDVGLWVRLDFEDLWEWEAALNAATDCGDEHHAEGLHWAATRMHHWLTSVRLMYPTLGWDQDLLRDPPIDHPDYIETEY